MKKSLIFSIASLFLIFGTTGCGNDESKENNNDTNNNSQNNTEVTLDKKLTSNGYSMIVKNQYQKNLGNESYYLFDLDNKTITYNSEEDDSQSVYEVKNNTAWMYGCRYHYDDDTTTNDGEGFGDCDDDTISFLKKTKTTLDNELKQLNITYEDLK